ncbi:MAG: hypothetical protein E6K95_04875 [Thaumarchaeota archaeon]|nr:MAG: hypothetical protein E6K95_04875 [Nitrososphaerota archaeon]
MEEPARRRISFGPRMAWALIGVLIIVLILFAAWTFLEWSIAEHVYSLKGGLDWFGINFYGGATFIAAALLALVVINPEVGKSDLGSLISVLSRRVSSYEESEPPREVKAGKWLWGLWQLTKWAAVFGFFVANRSFPFLGQVMNPIAMASQGLGDWSAVGRVLLLPAFPASGNELVGLMPTLEIQYRLVSYVALAFLTVFVIRMALRLLRNLVTRKSEVWLRNLVLILAAVVMTVILGAPYWLMDAATPYVYGSTWAVLAFAIVGWSYLGKRRDIQHPRLTLYKAIAVVIAISLVVQAGTLAFLYLNWNNNYLPYQWFPGTHKEITVTRWAAGLDRIQVSSAFNLPTSNSSTILNVVRQWDQQAAAVTNTKEIGAYNWMTLGSSEIVFLKNTEYWVSPTTPAFPSTDWVSEHLIYTHAARILVINTYNGSEIPPTKAYGIPSEPPIYYGEGSGFQHNVYVHVSGYNEIQNALYAGTSDYVLDGWQKSLWFTFAEGQLGFAFSGQPIQMLWNRNVFDRVQSVLIPGLVEDPAAYLASDGKSVFYVVQLYIDYPIQSGFSASDYLRFFGVALVNLGDGSMNFYGVSSLIGTNSSDFLTQFYSNYYSSWKSPPAWLVPQLRYPEQLLGSTQVAGQLDYDFAFHVNDPFVWRSATQFYERPESNSVQYIPWAVGNNIYFVGTQLVHFRSAASKNLAGLYIAYGGDRLGQIYLYENPSNSSTIIGPSAAENALTTNSQVRTQLTLLPNYRFGSYLLYSVGGALTYFVAVYTNPGTAGVVTQLPFMTAVNPTTDAVAVGANAGAAYRILAGGAVPVGGNRTQALLAGISSLVSSMKLTLVNATTVNPTVWIKTGILSVGNLGVNGTLAQVSEFLTGHAPGSVGSAVYLWTDSSSGGLDVGVFQLRGSITELYYITIML